MLCDALEHPFKIFFVIQSLYHDPSDPKITVFLTPKQEPIFVLMMVKVRILFKILGYLLREGDCTGMSLKFEGTCKSITKRNKDCQLFLPPKLHNGGMIILA